MTPCLYVALGILGSGVVVGATLWALARAVGDVLRKAVLR